MQETPTGISGSVVYRAELFKEQTIAAWMHQFDVLLHHIVAQPDMAIDVLDLYTAEEKMLRAKETLEKSQANAKRIWSIKGKAQYAQTELTEEHKLTLPPTPPESGNLN
ncbi:hypothetical protein ccbrp13_56740 [Ktedonobacteria bacterium brp13]|nr:hypothetical protein ccbrp13_56740 [Ktedonobacteria bacterium brp13]